MIWGDPIEVNGVRPAWLADDDSIWMHWMDAGEWSTLNDERWPVRQWYERDWKAVDQFRLPADHFAYLAIAKGFEPRGGGDSAPVDWDGSGVLLRDGDICFAQEITSWSKDGQFDDIIGYKRKQTNDDGDYVSVKRMTEAEAQLSWNSDTSTDAMENGDWHIELLRRMGLIRQPAQAETIATKTGLTVDQVQSVLNEVNNGTR